MAKIDINIDHDQDLTVFKVTGVLNAGELLESTKNYNDGDAETSKSILVDFTEASWTGLSPSELKTNTATAGKYSNKGDKYAFVFASDADYGIGRMVEAFASIENYNSRMRMFKSMDEALSWLKGE